MRQTSFVVRAFARWLQANRGRFTHPPVAIDTGRDRAVYRFEGIVMALSLSLEASGPTVWVEYRGGAWDLLGDFDVAERWDSSGGYWCALCKPEAREYYPTRRALWEQHSFERLLAWTNDNFTPGRWLVLYRFGRGSTAAELRDREEAVGGLDADRAAAVFPVVVAEE